MQFCAFGAVACQIAHLISAEFPLCYVSCLSLLEPEESDDDITKVAMQANQGDGSGPSLLLWDSVTVFDEISAAKGALGRFPGREVLPLLKQFIGRGSTHPNPPVAVALGL